MSIQHRTKKLGWLYESTEGTDGIVATYYEFGKRTQSYGDLPLMDFAVDNTYFGSRDPVKSITQGIPRSSIGYAPVNGLPFYHFLGGAADAGGGITTITGIDTGEQPYFTTRFQSENASENIRKSMTGSKTASVNFTVSRANERARVPAIMGQSLMGMDLDTPTTTTDITPSFPNSEEEMYYVDSNFVFTWDFGADAIDYSSELIEFKYIGIAGNVASPLNSSLTPWQVLEGSRDHLVQMSIIRGNDTSIYDDYIAQTRSSIGKDLRVKIYNSATNYLQLDLNDMFIDRVQLNDAVEAKGEKETYTVLGSAESLTVNAKDGLTQATFYQI